ncbi:MAG: hypothetical protein K9I84_10095 [Leadbetterella sp.]|nr:hypothetical protein [Leadbetterella sp.]
MKAVITTLNCSNIKFSAAATNSACYTGTTTVPYSGGNGMTYEEGTTYTGGSFIGNSSGWGFYRAGDYSNIGAPL